MATAFYSHSFPHYPELERLLEHLPSLVWEHGERVMDAATFFDCIAQAEKEKKIAVFHNMDFSELVVANYHFNIPILFTKCRFHGDFRSTHNQFMYKIFFHEVMFHKVAKFKSSSFFHGISFLACHFNGEASFERAKFLASITKYLHLEAQGAEILLPQAFRGRSTVDFLGVTFHGEVSFVNAHFGCSVLFSHYHDHQTKFYGKGDFSCITDEEEEFLLGTHHGKSLYKLLHLDTFHRLVLQGVEFFDILTFENRTFHKRTIFKDSIFYKAPQFHNAELHQDTDFRGTIFKDTYSEGAERAYRTLKLVMDKKRARREEGMFFALEQKSLLNSPIRAYGWRFIDFIRLKVNNFILTCVLSFKEKEHKPALRMVDIQSHQQASGFYVSLTEKILSFFYFLISNYGQSFKRPMLLVAAMLLGLFPLLYMTWFGDLPFINHQWSNAYQVSFQQLFRPFEVFTVRFQEHYKKVPLSFYIISSLQAVLNVGFVTLFALAVRGRFRMY